MLKKIIIFLVFLGFITLTFSSLIVVIGALQGINNLVLGGAIGIVCAFFIYFGLIIYAIIYYFKNKKR